MYVKYGPVGIVGSLDASASMRCDKGNRRSLDSPPPSSTPQTKTCLQGPGAGVRLRPRSLGMTAYPVVAHEDGLLAARRALSYPRMCGRFARKSTQQVLADWFGVDLDDMPFFAPTYNAAPQSVQPVVRLNRDTGQREFALMRWGLVPFWAKTPNRLLHHQRPRRSTRHQARLSRSPQESPLPHPRRRLLRVAKARRQNPPALRHRAQDGEPYAFAGLWERWQPRPRRRSSAARSKPSPSSPPTPTS